MTIESSQSRPASEEELRRVALDNIRDNQLGGQTDGVDAIRVGEEELGFTTTPEGVREISKATQQVSKTGKKPPTIAEQNATAARFDAEHIRRKMGIYDDE